MSDYLDNWWHQYLDVIPFYKCAHCKFANYYPAYWWYPHIEPLCSKGRGNISPDKNACNDFELIGRLSR